MTIDVLIQELGEKEHPTDKIKRDVYIQGLTYMANYLTTNPGIIGLWKPFPPEVKAEISRMMDKRWMDAIKFVEKRVCDLINNERRGNSPLITTEQALVLTKLTKHQLVYKAKMGYIPSQKLGKKLYFKIEDLLPFFKR